MKKVLFWILGIVLTLILIIAIIFGPTILRMMESSTEEIDENLTVFLGYGGNSIVLKSSDCSQVLIVDTKMGGGAKKLRQYVDSVCPNAAITVVNTHFHSDHIGGNNQFPDAKFIIGANDSQAWMKESGVDRMPDDVIPGGEERIINVDDEIVHIRAMGRAHTQNDVIVYLENRKLLVTGDLVFKDMHPALFKQMGTFVLGWVDALTHLIETYDIQNVVTGHGTLSGKEVLFEQREYFTSIENALSDPDRLAELKEKYKDYVSMPLATSFNKTVGFIREERGGGTEE